MLSIHEELLKLMPVDASAKSAGVVERPPDLIEQWRQMASAIAEVAAGQRRTVEQLEGFLQSVRSAAAETQRTAASSRAHLEDERAAIERDRAELRALLEKTSSSVPSAPANGGGSNGSLEEIRAVLTAQLGQVQSAVATQLEATTKTLLSSVRDEQAETLRLVAESQKSITTALSKELEQRHQEMDKLQRSAEQSTSAAAKQLTSAIEGIRESLASQLQARKADDDRLGQFMTEMRKHAEAEARARADAETRARAAAEADSRKAEADSKARAAAEAETRSRVEAETKARAAAEAETRSRVEAETKARAAAEAAARSSAEGESAAKAEVERVSARLHSTSTSMMAFLEVLDDVLSLPALESDAASQKSVNRLTTRAQRVLEAAGLTEIAAQGQPVDDELHEVVQETPASAEVPAGRVVRVVQRGFRNAERVLRRAQVVAAR